MAACPNDQPKDWPSIEQIQNYRQRIRQTLDQGLQDVSDGPLDRSLENGRLLDVAIEHRLMHVETLCYMLHQLPVDRKRGQRVAPLPPVRATVSQSIEIPAGTATLGLPRDAGGAFGWDNEFDEHRVDVPTFAIDSHNVTSGEYLKFMAAGGYANRGLWSEAGWEWINSQDRRNPVFWVRRDNSWYYRTMFDEVPLPLDWPVYVSHDEASAYCRWAGKELLQRTRMASRCLRDAPGHGTCLPVGRGVSLFAAWQF